MLTKYPGVCPRKRSTDHMRTGDLRGESLGVCGGAGCMGVVMGSRKWRGVARESEGW